MLSLYVNALVRTFTGYAVAWLLSLPLADPILTALGMDTATAKSGFVVVLGTAYYAAVKAIEQRWPAATVLLGSIQQPASYTNPSTAPAVVGSAVPVPPSLPVTYPDPFMNGSGAQPATAPDLAAVLAAVDQAAASGQASTDQAADPAPAVIEPTDLPVQPIEAEAAQAANLPPAAAETTGATA